MGETDCPGTAVSCLLRTCDPELDACVEEVVDACYAGGQCRSPGTWLLDGCGSCQPDINDRGWTLGDAEEPDNELATAHTLATPTTNLNGAQTTGWMGPWSASRLAPIDDVDNFRFTHEAVFTSNMPYVRFTQPEGVETRICVFMRCDGNAEHPVATTVHTCPGTPNTTTVTRPGGWVGSCRDTSAATTTHGINTGSCQASGQFIATTRVAHIEVQRVLPTDDTRQCTTYELQWGMKP